MVVMPPSNKDEAAVVAAEAEFCNESKQAELQQAPTASTSIMARGNICGSQRLAEVGSAETSLQCPRRLLYVGGCGALCARSAAPVYSRVVLKTGSDAQSAAWSQPARHGVTYC
jgi:hypothetical protein